MAGGLARAAGEIRRRYLRLYTGAIADMLDKNGCRRQVLPHTVRPFGISWRCHPRMPMCMSMAGK
jgi:hypothetical protein